MTKPTHSLFSANATLKAYSSETKLPSPAPGYTNVLASHFNDKVVESTLEDDPSMNQMLSD